MVASEAGHNVAVQLLLKVEVDINAQDKVCEVNVDVNMMQYSTYCIAMLHTLPLHTGSHLLFFCRCSGTGRL